MSSDNNKCFQCQETGHIAHYCPHIRCFDCDKYGHVAADCPDKIPPSGTPAHCRSNTTSRHDRSSSRHYNHTRCSHHDYKDRHRFSRSQSWSHNHGYRSSSHHDSHRSHSRSFHRPSHHSYSCHRSSSSYLYQYDLPHCRSSSHRNVSQDDCRSWPDKSHKQHYKLAQGSSSSSQTTPWKDKDRRRKQVTIDNPPSEYYSSDDQDSDSKDTSHTWRGLPNKDTITITHITDCPTVTIHAGKCYQALIDPGAAISLLQHSTYKRIEDCYKISIQPTAAKINTADGSPMMTLGSTALHLWVAYFKFTHSFIICDQLPNMDLIFSIDIQKKISLSSTWDKGKNCYIQWNGKFLAFTHTKTHTATIGTVNLTLKIPPRHNGVVPIKISGPLITTHAAHFILMTAPPKEEIPTLTSLMAFTRSRTGHQSTFLFPITLINTSPFIKGNILDTLNW